MTTPRLITITVSHYCEKARWALDRLGIAYREEAHPPGFHIRAARRAGGRRTVPVLVTEEGVFADSTEILLHLDRSAPPEARLYPTDPDARREVERLEDLFDEHLGPHTRRWGYRHLLGETSLLVPMANAGVKSRLERLLFRPSLPLLRPLMRSAMNITPAAAERSAGKIEQVYTQVAQLLADGRPYLVGDRLSAADIAFGSLAAPHVTPPEYGGPLPTLEEMPPQMRRDVLAARDTPAGAFALRLYRDDRRMAR